MSKSRRNPARRDVGESEVDGPDVVLRLARGLLVATLVVRWLWPTESAAMGDTLPLVQLTLLAGVLWGWGAIRTGAVAARPGTVELALLALVLAQAAATGGVFVFGGDRRAAVNVLWEWIAIGGAYFLLRQSIATRSAARVFVRVVIALVFAVSALGIWQHYVWYPQTAAEYLADRDQLDELRAKPPATLSASESRRLRDLMMQFQQTGIPVEGPGRKAFESRLLGSREPLGRFALANTLAGWLLPGTLALLALATFRLADPQRRRDWRTIAVCVATAAALFCLLLTKSRTAYVGFACGLVVWGVIRFGHRLPLPRIVPWMAAGLVLIGLGIGAAFATGGLDREVIAEAPRSLRFRLQYWTATWDVIGERPLLGTGPGNFRQHYTRYKLPAASEDVADPHNMLLETWATAGTPGLLAFLALLGTLFASTRRSLRELSSDGNAPPNDDASGDENAAATDVVVGAGFALLIVAGVDLLLAPGDAWSTAIVCVGSVVAFRLLPIPSNAAPALAVGLSGGVAGLAVHLLGAGGVGMPAIVLLALASLVVVRASADGARREDTTAARPRTAGTVAMIVFGVGTFAALFSATRPVAARNVFLAEGRDAFAAGRLSLAEERFEDAVERDPWSPDAPREAASTLQSALASVPGSAADRLAVRSLDWQREAVARNPFSASERARLAETARRVFELSRAMGDVPVVSAEHVLAAFAAAIERAPTDAALRAEAAVFAAEVGEERRAVEQARRALELDAINRDAGHEDRYLPESAIAELQRIVDGNAAASGERSFPSGAPNP